MADTTRAPRRAWASKWRLALIGGLLALVGVVWTSPAGASPCAQATISWDGGAGTSSWATPANWTGDRLPDASDHVCIPSGAAGSSVSHSGTTSIKSLEAQKPFALGGSLSLSSTTVASSIGGGTWTGTLSGPGELQIAGTVDWTSGSMTGSATVTVAPGARLNANGVPCCSSRLLGSNAIVVNNGTLFVGGSYGVNLGENFRIQNNGTFEIASSSDGHIADASSSTAVKPLITNAGTIVKTVGGNKGMYLPVLNQAQGTIKSNAGELQLHNGSGGTPHSGTFAGGVVLYGT
ncbi:MAG TPA: hypothetical protein VG318_17585, partial [Actinomycetota bacterium]|nr:hypothetical protein [Actinomycetota bacterium]